MFSVTAENTKHFYTVSYPFYNSRKHGIPKSLEGKHCQICLKKKKKETVYIIKDTKVVEKWAKDTKK